MTSRFQPILSPKKYFIISLSGGLALIGAFVVFNMSFDSFGVFGFNKNKTTFKTYNNEIIEKSYFSFNYIPKNYQVLIVGSSLSANLDPSIGDTNLGVYNLSVRGMNLLMVKEMLLRIIKQGQIKLVIFSMDPYFTREKAEPILLPTDIKGALGSVTLLKRYFFQILDFLGKKIYSSNHLGYINYNEDISKAESLKGIKIGEEYVRSGTYLKDVPLTDFMKDEMKKIFKYLKEKDIKIIIYYHPRMQYFHDFYKEAMVNYKNEVGSLLPEGTDTIDYYDEKYKYFISDKDNYTDIGHFSKEGGAKFYKNLLLPLILKKL